MCVFLCVLKKDRICVCFMCIEERLCVCVCVCLSLSESFRVLCGDILSTFALLLLLLLSKHALYKFVLYS